MKWNQDLQKAPIDTTLEFCDRDGNVYQGELYMHLKERRVRPLALGYHGCCSEEEPLPIAWRKQAKAPEWING